MLMRFYKVFRVVVLVVMIVAIALVFRTSPPPPVDRDPNAAQTLQAKLVEEQRQSDAKEPHKLEMNEAELNSMLSQNLQLAPPAKPAPAPAPAPAAPAAPSKDPTIEEVQSSVRDVKVSLLDSSVRAYVIFAFHGADLSLQLDGQLGVRDGYLRFTPIGGKLGSLPLPQAALDNAVAKLFDSPDNKEKFHVPPDVQDIRVEGNQLVVSYR
jgi:hypothetical protein